MRSVWQLAGLLLVLAGCEVDAYETGPEVFSDPIEHTDDSFVFSYDRINRIDLELDDGALQILASERLFSYPRNKVRARGTIDGEAVGDVGVRLRGGLGSFKRFDTKPKLEIDLNEFSGDRFYGLESLSLNSMGTDCSGLVESLAFFAYDKMGVAASRTGYAQLFVNGADYGLYLVVETQDDRWLNRNFEDNSGNFYDGKYVYSGYWPTIVDFGVGRDHWFDLEEGDGVGFEDIARISRGVKRADRRGHLSDALWSDVDWDSLVTLLRVEQWIINADGYAMGPNNYRVYFEPDGPMVVVPWDLDSAFPVQGNDEGTDLAVRIARSEEDGWANPESSLARVCRLDPDCWGLWEERGPDVTAAMMDGELLALGHQLNELIGEGLRGDPRKQREDDTPCGRPTRSHSDAVLDYLETGEAKRGSEMGCNYLALTPVSGGLWTALLAMVAACRRARKHGMDCTVVERPGRVNSLAATKRSRP